MVETIDDVEHGEGHHLTSGIRRTAQLHTAVDGLDRRAGDQGPGVRLDVVAPEGGGFPTLQCVQRVALTEGAVVDADQPSASAHRSWRARERKPGPALTEPPEVLGAPSPQRVDIPQTL